MKPIIEFLHFCPQFGKIVSGDRDFTQALEIFFHDFDSLKLGRNLFVTVR